MELITEYRLESLCEKTVTVLIYRYIVIDGIKTKVGETEACCYNNMPSDRERLAQLLPENYYHAILDVWGEEAVLPEIEHE